MVRDKFQWYQVSNSFAFVAAARDKTVRVMFVDILSTSILLIFICPVFFLKQSNMQKEKKSEISLILKLYDQILFTACAFM